MSHPVMFVCAANVCRSPLMAYAFEAAGATGSPGDAPEVRSRGVSVTASHRMCATAAHVLAAHAPGSDRASGHASVLLVEDDLEEPGLVIAAARDIRASIARISPAARAKTFTLKEAIALGAEPVSAEERARLVDAEGSSFADVTVAYAAVLHHRRGRISIEPAPRSRLPWVTPTDPFDVPDVHHSSARVHARTLDELASLTRVLRGQFDRFAAQQG